MADPIPVFNSPAPLNPADFETEQGKAALALGDDAPSQFKPYPIGAPLSLEDEERRARGELWREEVPS